MWNALYKIYIEKSTHAFMQGRGQMSFVFVTCLSPIVWLRGWIESGAVDWTPTSNSCGFRSSGQPSRLEGELDQKAVGRAPASAMNKEGKALWTLCDFLLWKSDLEISNYTYLLWETCPCFRGGQLPYCCAPAFGCLLAPTTIHKLVEPHYLALFWKNRPCQDRA